MLRVAYAAAGGKYASDGELGAAIAATCIGAPPVFYQGCETLLELKKPIAKLLGYDSNFNGVCNEIQVRFVCARYIYYFFPPCLRATRRATLTSPLPLPLLSQLCWSGLMWMG